LIVVDGFLNIFFYMVCTYLPHLRLRDSRKIQPFLRLKPLPLCVIYCSLSLQKLLQCF